MNDGHSWQRNVLSNGLTVLKYTRPSAMTTQLSLAIRYGSNDDHEDKIGTAHFLEQLNYHKKGNIKSSQFRKALGQKHNLNNEAQISDYIITNCSFKLLEVQSPKETIRLEHFITAIMAPILNTALKQ